MGGTININSMIKEEIEKQITKKAKSVIFKENVKNLFDAHKLLREMKKTNSPKLGGAKKVATLAEQRLREFFEEEWEDEYGPVDMVEDVVDNNPIYDALLSIMECAKQLYMSIDMDTQLDPLVVTKLQEAEGIVRTAAELMNQALMNDEADENEELSSGYIGSPEDEECMDCDDEDFGDFDDEDDELDMDIDDEDDDEMFEGKKPKQSNRKK